MTLTPEGGRVLGCLVEKQLTTPQQYPLTLNALMLACNQTTNRDPVTTFTEAEVETALSDLKQLRLVRFVLPSHGKSVTRYRHALDEAYGLDTARVSLLAVLLLRGPQTPGELRSRTARMVPFDSPDALQGELRTLAGQPEPLVRLLPRRPGQKEDRWQQLLAAVPGSDAPAVAGEPSTPPPTPPPTLEHDDQVVTPLTESSPGPASERSTYGPAELAALAAEVAALREELDGVRASLSALRRSLGE